MEAMTFTLPPSSLPTEAAAKMVFPSSHGSLLPSVDRNTKVLPFKRCSQQQQTPSRFHFVQQQVAPSLRWQLFAKQQRRQHQNHTSSSSSPKWCQRSEYHHPQQAQQQPYSVPVSPSQQQYCSNNINSTRFLPYDLALAALATPSYSLPLLLPMKHQQQQPKKQVRFAATNTVRIRSVTEHDLQNSWYQDVEYRAFERDNRQTVTSVLQQQQQQGTDANTSSSNSSKRRKCTDGYVAVTASITAAIHIIDDDETDEDRAKDPSNTKRSRSSCCTTGLELYTQGRKRMLKRKWNILHHSISVLDTSHGKQQQQQAPLPLPPSPQHQLLRQVSLDFSTESVQHALERAAAVAQW